MKSGNITELGISHILSFLTQTKQNEQIPFQRDNQRREIQGERKRQQFSLGLRKSQEDLSHGDNHHPCKSGKSMEPKYVIILDFCTGALNIIKLTQEELQESENYDDFESFLSTLEEKYGFKLNNCQWLTTETLNIYWYEDGRETDRI